MAKILIVDDEIDLIMMLKMRLEANGYEIITANNGEEGLESAKNELPDLIMLDIMMPRMDGFAMLQEVRKNEKIKNIPIIVCSGMERSKVEKESIKLGADAFVIKPIDSPILLNTIEELLKKSS